MCTAPGEIQGLIGQRLYARNVDAPPKSLTGRMRDSEQENGILVAKTVDGMGTKLDDIVEDQEKVRQKNDRLRRETGFTTSAKSRPVPNRNDQNAKKVGETANNEARLAGKSLREAEQRKTRVTYNCHEILRKTLANAFTSPSNATTKERRPWRESKQRLTASKWWPTTVILWR